MPTPARWVLQALPEAESLAAANKRVANILKQAHTKGESFNKTERKTLKIFSAEEGGWGDCLVIEAPDPRAAISRVLGFIRNEGRQAPLVCCS